MRTTSFFRHVSSFNKGSFPHRTEGYIFYEVLVFFSVTDKKLIESVHKKLNKVSVNEEKKLVFMRHNGGLLCRYHIIVKKFQYIILSVTEKKDNVYLLYDGPNAESSPLKPKGEIYTTTAFQCLIFTFTEFFTNLTNQKYISLSYFAKFAKINNIVQLQENPKPRMFPSKIAKT